jgi:hypothetical protein
MSGDELVRIAPGRGGTTHTWHFLAEREAGLDYTLCGLIGRTADTQSTYPTGKLVKGEVLHPRRVCHSCLAIDRGKERPRFSTLPSGWLGRSTAAGKIEFENLPRITPRARHGHGGPRYRSTPDTVKSLFETPERLVSKGATYKLPLIVRFDIERGTFLATSPDVPGLRAESDTVAEVLRIAGEVLQDELDVHLFDGEDKEKEVMSGQQQS